jgi:hypothetical protein
VIVKKYATVTLAVVADLLFESTWVDHINPRKKVNPEENGSVVPQKKSEPNGH